MPIAPDLLIEVEIAPKVPADAAPLRRAIAKLHATDPALRWVERASGQWTLGGMDEHSVDLAVARLKENLGVGASIGGPQVAYRETLGRRVEIDYTHKKQTDGSGQFARIKVVFEPGEPGAGFRFASAIRDRQLPRAYVLGVERGLYFAQEKGPLAGFPVIDFKATLVDGAHHDLDSSTPAFEIAARAAFKELRERGQPRLLEPVMKVEVTTPEAFVGDVIADLNARRGHILGSEQRADAQVIICMVPLALMLGYVNALQSMTGGRGGFEMQYDHYEAVPQQGPPDDVFPSAIGKRA